MIVIKSGMVFSKEGSFSIKDVLIDKSTISRLDRDINEAQAEAFDADGCYVVPGFIDLHTHGANGIEFMYSSPEEIDSVTEFFAAMGVTSFLPTTITAPLVKIVEAIKNIRKAKEAGTKGSKILGINLEGPFINRKYKGSHPEEYIINPSAELLNSLVNISGGNIRIVGIAPEMDRNDEIYQRFRNSSIILSVAHTELNYSDAQDVFNKGISHVTHLFNSMLGMHHREPGLVGAAFDNDNATVELIADCVHIHPPILRIAVRCKTPDRIALITDSSMAAGLDDGEYTLGGRKIIVKDGISKLSTGVLSGTTLTMINAVRLMNQKVGIRLEDVVKMASEVPARILHIDDKKGSIDAGKDADITVLDKDLNVKLTIVEGRVVYRG